MRNHAASPVLLLLAACALIGCENAETEKGVSWNGSSGSKPAATTAASSGTQGKSSSTKTTPAASTPAPAPVSADGETVADAVDFSALRWSFGGENGSGAVQSGVVISGLGFSKNGLSFHYVKNLSAWGLSYDDAHALACLFVQKADGSWVGGKFDWISSSRTTRGFENIPGYNGWSLAGVPNPCPAAFVIVSRDRRRRSNVLVGTWSR